MNILFRKTLSIFVILAVLISCNEDDKVTDPYEQLEKDIKTIDNYLTNNNIQAVKEPNGVRMVITELGTGLPALIEDKIKVSYSGKLFPDGAVFDEGAIDRSLSSLIDGWKIAFTTLPQGSKATLFIPSTWGYGTQSNASIPANSILQFNVHFVDVEETSSYMQRLAADTVTIDTYLAAKGIAAINDRTGIRYVVTQQGTGPVATWYDKVKIKYSFKLLSDDTKTVVTGDREPSEQFYSRTVDYIHAMKIGLSKLNQGSKATLYVPSGLAFGAKAQQDQNGAVAIPANSNLIIDLELIDIVE